MAVTPSTSMVAMTVLADPAQPFKHHISLMHGWVPWTVQALAAAVLAVAIGWRSARWRSLWLPLAAIVGLGAATWTHHYVDSAGLAGDPAPRVLWMWVSLTGLAVGVVLFGWRGSQWWRRGVSVAAVPLCALSSALALNLWVGYFPTVQTAWNQLTAGPLPDETDRATVAAMQQAVQQKHALPANGSVVPVTIDGPSGFKHRGELVYLPPAWFAGGHLPLAGENPPPRLPTVMMIGGEFNTPADWLRAGNAIKTIDQFAAAHGGNAPVLVFVDSGGAFNNDTECVNGTRGKAADHLVKDIQPFMVSDFGVSADRNNWGVVGWSMGGTCAVDLTVMHPDMFSAFVDVAGDFAPNSGSKTQTVARLFGGNADAYAAYDPTAVMTKHGPYTGIAGWFAISAGPQAQHSAVPAADSTATGLGGRDAAANPGDQTDAANSLCATATTERIDCAVIPQPGKHDWPFAANVFASALPWLAGQIGTPDVPQTPLAAPAPVPPASEPTQRAQAAGR
jgi:S-formylglutathione hydrolase FrmB